MNYPSLLAESCDINTFFAAGYRGTVRPSEFFFLGGGRYALRCWDSCKYVLYTPLYENQGSTNGLQCWRLDFSKLPAFGPFCLGNEVGRQDRSLQRVFTVQGVFCFGAFAKGC